MTIASLCNIALDVLIVYGFEWGVKGAAFGTVLAQLLAAAFCFIILNKIEILKSKNNDYGADLQMLFEQCRLGILMGLQNMITAIGGLIVQSVVNGYAMSAYTGQNMGAGLFERIKQGLRAANVIRIGTALLMSTVMLVFGRMLLHLFIAGDAVDVNESLQVGYNFLVILSGFFTLLYVLYIIRACVQGMGTPVLPMFSGVVQLAMRCGCALILPLLIGENGVFYGEVFAWIGADIMQGRWLWLKFRKWKKMRLVNKVL